MPLRRHDFLAAIRYIIAATTLAIFLRLLSYDAARLSRYLLMSYAERLPLAILITTLLRHAMLAIVHYAASMPLMLLSSFTPPPAVSPSCCHAGKITAL